MEEKTAAPIIPVLNHYVLKDFYSVNPPYAHVAIYYDEERGVTRYQIIEPFLSGREVDILNDIKEIILEEASLEAASIRDVDSARRIVESEIRRIVREYGIPVHPASMGKIVYYIVRDFIGYERIDPIYRDPYVEDIVCLPGFEEIVLTDDPVKVPIKKIFDDTSFPKIMPRRNSLAEVLSLDASKLIPGKSKVIAVSRRECWEHSLIEIEDNEGHSISVTPGHPLPLLTSRGIEVRRAQDIRRGDRLLRIVCNGGKSTRVASATVKRIRDVQYSGYVYDLKLDPKPYFTSSSGIVLHNCDGVNIPIYVYHRVYEWVPTNVIFPEWEKLERFIRRLAFKAGQSITYARPIVEGPLLPEGFRAHLTLKEVSRRGATFTIRKYSEEPYTIVDLINFNTISPRIAGYLWVVIDAIIGMLIAGPMASGKSVSGDEYTLVTVNGIPRVLTFDELWRLFAHDVKRIKEFDVVEPLNAYTYSLNFEDCKLDSTPVGLLIRHRAPGKLYLIKTRLGRCVKVTGDHSLIVLDGETGNITVKTPKEIRVGVDYLPSIGKLNLQERRVTLCEIVEELIRNDVGDRIYVAVTSDVKRIVDEATKNSGAGGLREILKTRSNRVEVIKLRTLYDLIKLTGIKPKNIMIRGEKSTSPMYDLEEIVNDVDFARLIGYYMAEGHFDGDNIEIVGADWNVISDIIGICEKLGIPYDVVKRDNEVPVVNVKSVIKWVIIGLDVGKVAEEKALPSIFFVMPKEWKANLHRGYFSANGIVSSGGSIDVSTTSRRLAYQLIYALAVFGIHPQVSVKNGKHYRLSLSPHYAKMFVSEIGLTQENKNERIIKPSMEKYYGAEHGVVPKIRFKKYGELSGSGLIIKNILSECDGGGVELEDLWKLVEPDIIFSEVTSIEEVENKSSCHVYDFEIPLYQNFIAGGGIIVHNTTLLNAVSMLIRPEVKIVTIEDTPELRLPHENWVPMITRPSFEPGVQDVTLFDLLKSALRQRPEYIIVGEIRGEEAYTFFQAMAVGYGGMCLPGYERIPAIVDGKIGLYRIGDVIDNLIDGKIKDVKVLAYDVEKQRASWYPITGFIKMRESNRFIKFKLDGDIELTVHENHPVIVASRGGFTRKLAKDVSIGDYIPILKKIPVPEEVEELDLIEFFANNKNEYEINVVGVEKFFKNASENEYEILDASEYCPHDYRNGPAIPLKYYLVVEKLYDGHVNIKEFRRKLRLKYGAGAGQTIPAIIPLSRGLGYIIGLFLASGSVDCYGENRLPRRVVFHLSKKLRDKVISVIKSIGFDDEAVSMRCYSKSTAPHIVIDNEMFAILLCELVDGKIESENRTIPLNIALKAPREFREGILEGYWDGNRSVVHGDENACNIIAINRDLAESIVLLAKSLGMDVSIHEINNGGGFEGGSVIYALKFLDSDLTEGMNIVDPAANIVVAKRPLERGLKVKSTCNILYGKVLSIDRFTDDVDVYDFEVAPHGNFAVTSRCVITSNCTIHGESIEGVIARLEGKPMNIPRNMIPLAKLVLLMSRVRREKGPARRLVSVTEIAGYDPRNDEIIINEVFKWDPVKDSWNYSGRSILLEEISKKINRPLEEILEDWKRRSVVLNWMAKSKLRKFQYVADITRKFHANPDRVYEMAVSEVGESV